MHIKLCPLCHQRSHRADECAELFRMRVEEADTFDTVNLRELDEEYLTLPTPALLSISIAIRKGEIS